MNIDATLYGWVAFLPGDHFVIGGNIKDDKAKRFEDDTYVTTSPVLSIHTNKEGQLIARTQNSVYLLGV